MIGAEPVLGLLDKLWWYLTLAVTGIVTEEATPLLGGLAAHEGQLRLSMVVVVVAAGTWTASMVLYWLGRWRSAWLRRRWPKLRPTLIRMLRVVRRHPWRASLAVRVAFGLRITLPLACGVAQVPVAIYAAGAAASCLVWSALFTLLGWWFGETAKRALVHVERYDQWVVGGVVVLAAAGFLYARWRRGRLEREVVDVLAAGDEPR